MALSPDAAVNTADTTVAAAPARTEATPLTWRVHRLRESPRGIFLVMAAVFAALWIGNLLALHPITLLIMVVALLLSLGDFLLPIKYRLTDRGAHADVGLNRLFIAWEDVRRATHGSEGIFLSPFSQPSRLDAFRGVRLRYGADNRDEVLATVRNLRPAKQDEPVTAVAEGENA